MPSRSSYTFDDTEILVLKENRSAALTFFKRPSHLAYAESVTTLFLAPAENKNGYILVGKEEVEYDFTWRTLTGSWLVTDYFIPPHSSGSSISQEEIEQFIGVQLKFGPDYLISGTRTCSVGEYRKELVTAREFDDLFRLSTSDDLSIAAVGFNYFNLQTGEEQPFGSHIYRYDFENAFVVYEGILFRITELKEDPNVETIFDKLADIRFALPDENGFVEGLLLPETMMPGSIIYYTDDTHYIIITGGIGLDTPQKVEDFRNSLRTHAVEIIRSGAHLERLHRPSDGMSVTYNSMDDGGIFHIYPRDYPREKLAADMLNWCYDDETCRAVASGLDTAQPKLYYQAAGRDWEIYPLSGLENLTEKERASLVLAADARKVTVTVLRDGKTIVKEIEVTH